MLPTLTTRKDDTGHPILVLNYTSLLDPLIRAIATEYADNEAVGTDLDLIADLAQSVEHSRDIEDVDGKAAELSYRIDQFLDSVGHATFELPSSPNRFAVSHARYLAAQMRATADRLTGWADQQPARQASAEAA